MSQTQIDPSGDNESHSEFYLKFWGVRGSIAAPGPDTYQYGGNTACIEVKAGNYLLILDGGTGLRRLGAHLTSQYEEMEIHIFLSHLHWDHIQGIPFFTPAFKQGNRIHFYGERKGDQSLKEILEAQMHSPNFPVPLSIMQAQISFQEVQSIDEIRFSDDLVVKTGPMNHPNGCIGIRVEYKGRSIVYNTDTEHDPNGTIDQNVVKLAQGADVLIYDSMYTEEEYRTGRIGWGHSTYSEAIRIAEAAQVKQLFFYHHDPEHSDQFLNQKLQEMREITKDKNFVVDMAREGYYQSV